MKINILTNHSAPNSRAFNTPLVICRDRLKEAGNSLAFFTEPNGAFFSADILFINSNFFRTWWGERKDEIFEFLEHANGNGRKVFWFDTTDSTWVTQFEVLPYVDKFLKSHVFKNRKLYLNNFRTGRIFTDYFDELYNAGEKEENYPCVQLEEHLAKIAVSWTPCFERYDENRYSFSSKLRNLTAPYLLNIRNEKLELSFTPPDKKRSTPVSARFGLSHSRPSVVAHRKAVAGLLEKREVDTSRIALPAYFAEMRNSRISVSPFGVGEFCYRDYESIICGATLLKPDMSHLETWPDLYQDNKTCIFHKWDLSDFDEKIDFLLENNDKRLEIASNAQNLYKKTLSPEGIQQFAERLIQITGEF